VNLDARKDIKLKFSDISSEVALDAKRNICLFASDIESEVGLEAGSRYSWCGGKIELCFSNIESKVKLEAGRDINLIFSDVKPGRCGCSRVKDFFSKIMAEVILKAVMIYS